MYFFFLFFFFFSPSFFTFPRDRCIDIWLGGSHESSSGWIFLSGRVARVVIWMGIDGSFLLLYL